MKSLILRSSVALACALSLAGCGGGGGSLLLGGSILGLTKDGLVLQNNGGDPLTITAGQSTFAFPTLLGNDKDFDVTIKTQPAHATCTVAFGKGRTGAFNVTSVVVTCITDSYTLGGKVNGLNANGLVLVNGSDRLEVPANASTFTFANKVFDGAPYGVSVLASPAGLTCDLAKATGTMTGPVSDIEVTCH